MNVFIQVSRYLSEVNRVRAREGTRTTIEGACYDRGIIFRLQRLLNKRAP